MEPFVRIAELEAENEILRARVASMRAWIERATELIAVLGGQSTIDAHKARHLVRETINDTARS